MLTYQPKSAQIEQAQAYFNRYPEELEYETDDGFEIVKTTNKLTANITPSLLPTAVSSDYSHSVR